MGENVTSSISPGNIGYLFVLVELLDELRGATIGALFGVSEVLGCDSGI